MGLSAAAQLVFAGTTGTATNIGLLLTQLRYTRVAEREADGHAMRMLKNAGISAKGFGDFFERLEPKRANPAGQDGRTEERREKKKVSLGSRIFASEILRTHPLTAERLALVRAQPAYPATPALVRRGLARAARDVRCHHHRAAACSSFRRRPANDRQPGPTTTPPPQPRRRTAPSNHRPPMPTATSPRPPRPWRPTRRRRRAATARTRLLAGKASTPRPSPTTPRPASCGPPTPLCTSAGALPTTACASTSWRSSPTTRRSGSTPTTLCARNSRGNTNRALKRYQDALTDFDELIKIRPTFVFAFYNRGLTNVDMGRPDDATRDFTSALGIDKDYAGAYTQRGLLHEKAGAREPGHCRFRAAIAAPAAKYESGPWAQRVARERLKGLGVEVP